jgi:hypothetical protein
MSAPLCHRLLRSTICFFLPTLLFSQVIIREKVELRPRLTPMLSTAADSVLTYFDPPPLVMQDGFPTVTLTCRLEVRGAIDQDPSVLLPGEIANIVFLRGTQEFIVRSINRDPAGWGGSPHSTDTRFQGVWGKGGGVECRMYGFNSNVWFDARREISLIQPDSSFGKPVGMFAFRAQFYRYQAPSIWITGSALATADIVPEARLARWEVRSSKIQLSNDERAYIEFTSYDSTGAVYWPIRVPGAIAPVTVEVRAKGPYAYLEGANEEGKLIVQMLDWSGGYSPTQQVELVFDPRRGRVPNNRDTVTVVVTGGEKTDSVQVDLVYEPLDHFIEHLEKDELKYEEGTAVTVIAKDLNDEEAEIDTTHQVVIRATSGGTSGGGAAAKLTQKVQLGEAKVQRLMERPEAGSFVVDGGNTIPDEVTVPYGIARRGKVKYVANGRVPLGAGPEAVTIRAEALDANWKYAEAVVMVRAEELCPVVEFAKKRIGPGDTVRVTIKGKKPDGTIVEYRPERIFDIQIIEGAEFGLLRSIITDETGTSFEQMGQPFEFIAMDSLTVDSAVVQIAGYPSPSGRGEDEIPASTKDGGDKSHQVVSLKKESSEKKAARAAALARLLSENTCEMPVAQVVVKTSRLDHFELRLEAEEIAFTEASKIYAQAKDAQNQDIEFDEKEKLLFYLMINSEYGTFIDASGDTVKTSPPSLPDVSYGDAHDGKIRFAAVRTNPQTETRSTIRAEWQQDPTKMGEKEITVVDQTLKIVMIGPREVRPLIPEEIITLPGNQGRIIPGNAMTELRVRVTRKGVEIAGHPFVLSSDYVDGSGGHDHLIPRRPRTLENYGSFATKQGTPTQANNPFEGTTSTGSDASIVYTASIFGDRMLLTARSAQTPLLWDTVSIAEKVPDLIGFSDTPYWNLTGNMGPTSYGRCQGTQIRHGVNHHGTTFLIERLVLAIYDFFQWSGDPAEGPGTYLKLGINDISLPYGGLFDICNNWMPGHTYHRTGASVDIDGLAEDFVRPGVFMSLEGIMVGNKPLIDYLTRFMKVHGGNRFKEEPIHYGFGGK